MLRIARERLGYMVQHYANLEGTKLGKPVCAENIVLIRYNFNFLTHP